MSIKKHIVYLGCPGFPYGLAEIQKIILISKGLVNSGNDVTVISRKGTHNVGVHPELKANGNYQGIGYIYASGTPFRSSNFFERNIFKFRGIINEFLVLRKMIKENKLDFAILSTNNYYSVLYYVGLSKILGFKTIFNYVEYYPGQRKKWYKFSKRLNDQLFDKYAAKHVDAVLPISEFLINNLNKIAPQKKYLKIPVLTDSNRYIGIETQEGDKYFLFCGDAAYNEIIKFVIDSFEKLDNANSYLYLVINGSEKNVAEIKTYINNSICSERIKFLTKLTDKELSFYYKNAIALLIPLRPTLQDKARFPHKIGEYLASGNPVISTDYGEVRYYFKDMENMLIAEKYEIDLFKKKMQFVIDNPESVKKIGLNGQRLAKNIFDYRAMGVIFNDFLNSGLSGYKVTEKENKSTRFKMLIKNLEK